MKKAIIITVSILLFLGILGALGYVGYKILGGNLTGEHNYFIGYVVTDKTKSFPQATAVTLPEEIKTPEDIKSVGQAIFNGMDPKPEGVLIISIYKLK